MKRYRKVVSSTNRRYRPDMVNASDVKTYRNKRNPNKYEEVKNGNDGHTAARQYMKWNTDEGEVKNYNGCKSRRGRYSRMRKDSVNELLNDYEEVTSVTEDKPQWERDVIAHNNQRYSVRYNTIDTSPGANPTRMLALFQGEVSEIHPYDEGNYTWARFGQGKVNYIQDGRVVDTTYYTSADDCDMENCEWCDSVIQGIIENLEYLNADVEEKIIYNTTDVNASNYQDVEIQELRDTFNDSVNNASSRLCKKFDLESIQSELWTKVKEIAMSPEFGFEEKEVPMYFRVDPIFTDGRLEIEIGAEVDYDGMETLAEALDPIVDSYSEGAYFDMEAPGLMSAWLDYEEDVESSTAVEGSRLRDHDTEEQMIEVQLDTNIEINDEGYFDYEDTSWATDLCGSNGWVQSYDYPNVDLIEEGSLIETIDDFLVDELPDTPGIYHVVANFELYFDVEGVYDNVHDGGWDDREGFWEDYDTVSDNAHVTYNKDKSKMLSFSCERSLN